MSDIEVTQADIDAFGDVYGHKPSVTCDADLAFLEVLARHRTQSTAAKDARIAELERALADSSVWLQGALNCKEWVWDDDQRHLAEDAMQRAEQALASKGDA